jgi:thioredoxin-like negative regulator of GroEL
MKSFGMRRFLHIASLTSLSILVASSAFNPKSLVAQELPTGPNQAKPIDPNAPNVVSPTSQETGILSLQGGTKLMQEANSAVSAQNYPLALKKLQEARQVFNQLSNFYQELAGSFSGIDNRIADGHRRKALDTAQMRDDATYNLALVHRAQNQPELAVPLLVQIIRSQQPTRDLGKRAYQQLFELGFVDSPFPRPSADSSAPSSTSNR